MALPLAVFEDRNAPAAQAGSGKAALPISNPGTGQKNVREAVPRSASQAGLQLRRKQPEVSSTPHSLAQSVMLLRSQQPSSSQPQSTRPASTSKPATGHSEELVLPDDVLSPPSPRSMQILGKSRGLKRDRLESSQPTPPAKRPAINPNSASKPRLHKFKAAAPSMVLSPPQKAQPVGSNWWAQGTAQPVQAPGQLAPATHASLVQDHSRGGLPSQSGAQHMQPSGQQGSASWQPAYPSSPPVPDQAYPRGNNHVPSSSPAWASAHAQTHAEAWQSSPPVSTLPAKRAKQQPFRQPGPEHHSSAPRQQPRAGTYTGRSQDMQMQDLVNEVLAHDTPACWTNGSMHKQHSRAGAPSWPEAAGSQAHPANGHGPGQRGQAHLQPEQSWPAPDGGRYILAPAPASKKQQFKTRSAQAEWRAQRPGQQDTASASLDNGCVACDSLYHHFAGMALEYYPSYSYASPATARIGLSPWTDNESPQWPPVKIRCTHKGKLCRHATPAGHAPALQGGLQQLHQEVEQFAAMAAPTVVRTPHLL